MSWERRRDDPKAQWNRSRTPKAKRNTKRWCRGKEGVEHVPVVIVPANTPGWRWGKTCQVFK